MIYTIRIKCVWGMYLEEPFVRTVEIDSRTSLLAVHKYIQELTEFDDDHCFDFFIGKSPRDMRDSFGQDGDYALVARKLKTIKLADIFPLPWGQKLYYWFDFGGDWKFELVVKKEAEPIAGVKYPRIIAEKGPKPIQYPSLEE